MKSKIEEQTQNAKRLIKRIIFLSGFVLIMAGTALLANPGIAIDFIGLDRFTAMAIGCALVIAGIADFVVSRMLFRDIDRR